jgi:hypothetical protein
MTYFVRGPGQGSSTDVTIGSPGGSGAPDASNLTPNAANVGKLTFDVTRPTESVGAAAGGVANTVQAIGKGVVNVIENIPIVGLATKPAIGAIGAVADATIGNVVNAVAQSPVGGAIDFAATKAAEVALTPLDWALKAITYPSHIIARQTAEARIRSTMTGEMDPLALLTGPVSDQAIMEVKNGKTIEQVAEEMSASFGGTQPKMGAFSQDAFANFAWTMVTDPFTWFGGELFKPFQVGKIAMEANAIGVGRLRSLAELAEAASKEALAVGDKKLGQKLAKEAAKNFEKARLGEKFEWWGNVYKGTFGRVKNPLSSLIGSGTSKELGRRTLEAVASPGGNSLLNRLEVAAGKRVVGAAVADSALTLAHAGAAGVQELVVSAGRNIPESLASNLTEIAHRAIAGGADAAKILETEIAEKVTFGQLLKSYNISDDTAQLIAKKLVEGYDVVPKNFSTNPEVRQVINSLTDYISKANIKSNPERYRIQAEVLGRSNLRLFGDAAVETINRNKLILQRFADNPEQGIAYLANMLQHGFELTQEKALELATAQFAEFAGNSRELINALELARGASFGKSIRMLANEKAGLPRTFSEVTSTIARRKDLAAKFPNLNPEEAYVAATTLDAIAYAASTKLNISIEEYYAQKVAAIVSEDLSKEQLAAFDAVLYDKAEKLATLRNTKFEAYKQALDGPAPAEISELVTSTPEQAKMSFEKFGDYEVGIPGGIGALDNGTWDYWDLWRLKSQQINPNRIPEGVRERYYGKLFRSHDRSLTDPVDLFNRVIMASFSPGESLIKNEGLAALFKVQNMDDVAKLGAIAEKHFVPGVPFKDFKDAIANDVIAAFDPKAIGGAAVNDRYAGLAMNAMNFKNHPEWFVLKAGENQLLYSERLTSALYGAGLKVGNFATMLGNPAAFERGTIDFHMVEVLLREGYVTVDEIAPLLGKNGKYIAPEGKSITFRNIKGVSINEDKLPAHLKEFPFQLQADASGKQIVTHYGGLYQTLNDALGRMMVDRGIEGFNLGGYQWMAWDMKRGIFEPHLAIFPGVQKLPKMSAEVIKSRIDVAQKAGYFAKTLEKRMPYSPSDGIFYDKAANGVVRGFTAFDTDGKAILGILKSGDITTALHEIGHFARRQLTDADTAIVEGAYKNNGVWDAVSEERFAKEFVAYLSTGRAPIRELRDVFSKMREMISKIWADLSNGGQVEVNKDLTKVFDRLFIANPETTAAPAEHVWSRLTLVSTRHMTQQVWNETIQKADGILGLTDGGVVSRDLDQAVKESSRFLSDEGSIAKNGGATYNPFRSTVRVPGDGKGLSVAWDRALSAKGADGLEGLAGTERVRFLEDQRYRDGIMRDFIERNKGILEKDNFYVGLYDNGKRVYIDVSRVFNDLHEAINHGIKNGEESIFSFAQNGDKAGETLYLNTEKGIAQAAIDKEKVISSIADIADVGFYEMKKTAEEIEKALRPLADDLTMKYDDVARLWYNKKAPAIDIINYVRDHPEVITRDLSAVERANLPERFAAQIPDLERAGYRYALAPENGVLERTVMVQDSLGRDRLTQMVSPFTDLMDQAAVENFDKTVGRYARRPTIMDRLVDKMTRQYGSEVVKNSYIERFTTKIMKDANLSQTDALRIIARVGGLAAEQQTRPAGLWIERAQVEEIFRQAMGNENYKAYIAKGFKPFDEIVKAAAGDFGVVGLAPGASGRAKAFAPQMTVITDRAAPMARFGKINPVFWNWLEPIETKLGKLVHDIKYEFFDEVSAQERSALVQKMSMDNRYVTREIADGLAYDQGQLAKGTLAAAEQAPGFLEHVAEVLRVNGFIKDAKAAVLQPDVYKRIARDVTAAELGTRQVYDLLWKYSPGAMKDLAEFGLTDAQSLVAKIVEDGMIASSPEAIAKALAEGRDATLSLWEDALRNAGGLAEKDISEIAGTAYGVFQDSMIRGTRIADKYQYFSQYRTWFERSINHPFLGIYPYSYMTQKAIPMMLTILFKPRIAGQVRPLLGLTTYLRFKDYLAMETASNEGFMNDLVKNRALWYFVNMSLPATPENMGFSMPSFIRKGFLTPAASNQPIDFQQLSKMPTYVGDTLIRGTVLGQGGALLSAAGSLGSDIQGSIQGGLTDGQQEILNFFGK